MLIEFRKINSSGNNFSYEKDVDGNNIKFFGVVTKESSRSLYKIVANLVGDIALICDISGEEFVKNINLDLVLYISDGMWNMQNQNIEFDVIEFYNGFIDFDYILESEIESIKSDYHIKE